MVAGDVPHHGHGGGGHRALLHPAGFLRPVLRRQLVPCGAQDQVRQGAVHLPVQDCEAEPEEEHSGVRGGVVVGDRRGLHRPQEGGGDQEGGCAGEAPAGARGGVVVAHGVQAALGGAARALQRHLRAQVLHQLLPVPHLHQHRHDGDRAPRHEQGPGERLDDCQPGVHGLLHHGGGGEDDRHGAVGVLQRQLQRVRRHHRVLCARRGGRHRRVCVHGAALPQVAAVAQGAQDLPRVPRVQDV
mmetsp:Transcript_30686/g.76329  ORF Transcript_30686/g.76329 Transcript_30686/m.76329 type:complete len:243 (+) Transcript_30686:772-1500(+)